MTERFMLDDAGELIDKETAQFIEYGEKVCDLLNDLTDDNCQLKRKALDMEMDRDYYRTKSASLEEGYLQLQRENEQLRKENHTLKQSLEADITQRKKKNKNNKIYIQSQSIKPEFG